MSTSNVKELTIKASRENFEKVLAFVDERLEELGCTPKAQMQIDIALEEIYVDVSSYAYPDGKNPFEEGKVTIRVEDTDDPKSVAITLTDRGIPFDPLAKEDPDITLSAEERRVGGLGIFMVKKSMDLMKYEYKDGQNILTFRKDL